MLREILYMLTVVGAVFLANYVIRALPFLLFAGRSADLPKSVERFGALISPVIIAGLIVYSYSGLAWKTAWPYVAGALTVGLQLWRRNALLSIVAGTVLYMCLLSTGCRTRPPIDLDARHPSVSISTTGLRMGGRSVSQEEVVAILKDYDIPRERVVHILLESDVRDLKGAHQFLHYMRVSGYPRSILVTERHSESRAVGKPKRPPTYRVTRDE